VATIYFAGGCFWGIEKYFASVRGVLDTDVGYANGVTQSPSYRDVCTGTTGYAEALKVDYDPAVAPLPFLLDLLYEAIDPTSLNRQGNDCGTQYRTGVYYADVADAPVIARSLAALQARQSRPLAIESGPLTAFFEAEEYHQDYLDKNPGGYCHIRRDLFEKAAKAAPDASHFAQD
jgi:peptide methionine sulfoxide reductase msrA/msrB